MPKTDPVLLGVPVPALLDASTLEAHDALVLVAPSPIADFAASLAPAVGAAAAMAALADAGLRGPRARPPVVVAAPGLPGGRLILAPMAPLTEETDDARALAEATSAAVARAVEAGAARPLIAVGWPDTARFARAREVAALSALATRWAPLEAREAEKAPARARTIGVLGLSPEQARALEGIEAGKALCRDITGTEPERMAPRRAAALCEEAFAGTGVAVTVEHDVSAYPLIAAVGRASMQVERHKPCVVVLDYRPEGEIERTLILAGKGVVYDTGGADLKTDGHMAGMSRDKGGAGSVAGLVRAAAALRLPRVRVIGVIGFVRNSAGEDAFVSDEIIRARSGVRVRIGNTDAEGRLVLADLLARGKELCAGAPQPVLCSVATLTGHVYRAFGPYTGAIGNGAARGVIDALDELGELWAEPFERSRPRREDYTMVAPKTSAEDVVSANRLASVNTARGHQYPFAFLDVAAGLKGAGIPFLHLDIAGTVAEGADWQFGRPTGVPIAALIAYLFPLMKYALLTFAFALVLSGCSKTVDTDTRGAPASGPTYHRDIEPLVDVKCGGCHVEGGIAPFPLSTYDQVVAQKEAVKGSVAAGTMPPWPPADTCGEYLGDRSLSADQIAALTRWVDDGAPAGDPADVPIPVADDRTTLSRVDRKLQMPAAYTPQIRPDDYRCFLLDWPDTETAYVTGVGVEPGHASIVHHVIAYLAGPSQVAKAQALDDADPGPGWTCFGGPGGALGGDGWVGAWAPGALGADYPEGTGIEIAPGSKIILQLHYNTATTAPVPDQSSIVLKVDETVQKKAVLMPWTNIEWVLAHKMDIPAHTMDAQQSYAADPTPYMGYIANGAIGPNKPFSIHMAGLHMHTRGTRAVTRIERAGGGEECLLDIEKWSFHWQGSYAFRAPKRFNPGDKLALTCHWDNPGASDLNWGEGTGDEMCLGLYYATE